MNPNEAVSLLKIIDSQPGMNPLLFGEIAKVVFDHLHKVETDHKFRLMLKEICDQHKIKSMD